MKRIEKNNNALGTKLRSIGYLKKRIRKGLARELEPSIICNIM